LGVERQFAGGGGVAVGDEGAGLATRREAQISAVWHSENEPRVRRVLTAWEPHKPWLNLPSILAARLRRVGLEPLRQTPIPILNTSYNPASASYWVARSIRSSVVGRQNVTDEDAAEWLDEFAKLEERGAYFFSLTPVLTEAVKIA
jgi:arsenite methyltransferase